MAMPLSALAAPGAAAETRVVSVVKVKAPWWAPDFLIRNRFEASIPRHAAVPGLLRKFFTLSDDGELGGIYLWESRADADAFTSETWGAARPASLEIERFEAPVVLDNESR